MAGGWPTPGWCNGSTWPGRRGRTTGGRCCDLRDHRLDVPLRPADPRHGRLGGGQPGRGDAGADRRRRLRAGAHAVGAQAGPGAICPDRPGGPAPRGACRDGDGDHRGGVRQAGGAAAAAGSARRAQQRPSGRHRRLAPHPAGHPGGRRGGGPPGLHRGRLAGEDAAAGAIGAHAPRPSSTGSAPSWRARARGATLRAASAAGGGARRDRPGRCRGLGGGRPRGSRGTGRRSRRRARAPRAWGRGLPASAAASARDSSRAPRPALERQLGLGEMELHQRVVGQRCGGRGEAGRAPARLSPRRCRIQP